jgi:Cu-processing system permease protein
VVRPVYGLFFRLAVLILSIAPGRNEITGISGYGRTAASLINLVLLFVPLIALITGSISISGRGERDAPGLLSHPVTKAEVFVRKFSGILVPICFSISLGFGLAGIGVALRGRSGDARKFGIDGAPLGPLAASLQA